MKKRLLSGALQFGYSAFFILLSACAWSAENPSDLFARGAHDYEAEKFLSAAGAYQEAFKNGLKNGNVFYNIGNCHLKNDELSRAILNYEKAKIFMPGDSDLVLNYRYARSLMKQDENLASRHVILWALDKVFEKIGFKGMIILGVFLFYGLTFYFIWAKIFKKSTVVSNFVIVLWIFLLAAVAIPLKHRLWDMETGAIVMPRIIDARFEPSEESMSNFPLYEGMKVNVTRKYGKWYRIRRTDGRIGWIKSSDVAKILPL